MLKASGRSLLIGGLATLAYVYFTKSANRDKAKTSIKNTKTKVSSFLDSRQVKPTMETKAGHSDPNDPDDNRMVEEGSMYSVQYYNDAVQNKTPQSGAKQAFPKSQKQKMPKTDESLYEDNKDSPAKQENTDRNSPN